MEETILSGNTDTVLNLLHRNSFGEKLRSINSRNSSMRMSGFNTGALNVQNDLPLPAPLGDDIIVDNEFLL